MKKSIKFYPVALAALMALGSLTAVSCDKENDVINPQTEQETPALKRWFDIDPMDFTDATGTVWQVKGRGHIHNPGKEIAFDIRFNHAFSSAAAERPRIWDFYGIVTFDAHGNHTITLTGVNDYYIPSDVEEFLCEFAKYWLGI